MNEIIKNIYSQAKKIGACDKFKGTEDLKELIKLFLSPQGLEFCMNNHFPHISTLRLFKGKNVAQYGIYIDAGNITLTNPVRAVLIGHTNARIICSADNERNNIYIMHGATATIHAYNWSVTFVKVERGSYIKVVKDHAVVL